ncbi:MAG: hypothetical protein HN350_06025 [Phycisphaerales bacterium]|jgi:Ca2+-binding EF-hand superfamily protein|nr:hypothetical protein [Phycisphaerales bacterium]
MTHIRPIVLSIMCLIVVASATAAKPTSRPKAKPRKCPADKVVIGGYDIADILKMLGAKRQAGASDDQLRAYVNHFNRSDPNHDGKQTRDEYVNKGKYMNPRARAGIFGATDNNADDVATQTEYVLNRIITDEAKSIVQKTDTDKNGKVTRTEFIKGSPIKDKALAGKVYDALDTNSDKIITIPEYLRVWGSWARPNYKAQEATLAKRLAKLDKKPAKPKPGGKPAGKPAGNGPPSVDRVFKIMDSNKDGKLTKTEFRGPKFVFTGADTNKDGVVTRKEMETFHAKSVKKTKTKPGKTPR